LSELPDTELRHSENLVEICSFIQALSERGLTFVEQLDEYRKQIDYTYGD
jgi:cysteinyl-tRNA synthetase